MKTKRYALICVLLALLSYLSTRISPNNKAAFIFGLLLSVIALSLAVFTIILKEQTSKKTGNLIILLIGAVFLVLGIYL